MSFRTNTISMMTFRELAARFHGAEPVVEKGKACTVLQGDVDPGTHLDIPESPSHFSTSTGSAVYALKRDAGARFVASARNIFHDPIGTMTAPIHRNTSRPLAACADHLGLYVVAGTPDAVVDHVVSRWLALGMPQGGAERHVAQATIDNLLAVHRRAVDASRSLGEEVPSEVLEQRAAGTEDDWVRTVPARGAFFMFGDVVKAADPEPEEETVGFGM